jgi:hypothetical protein
MESQKQKATTNFQRVHSSLDETSKPKQASSDHLAPDSLHRSDSSRPLDRADPNPAPVPQQAATVDPIVAWGVQTRDSTQFRFVHGQLQRSEKPQAQAA